MDEKTLTQRIKEVCEQKDLTISKLEKDLDFSSGLISRWDKTSPSIDRVVAVAKYLQTSVDYLLGLKDDNNQNILKAKFINTLLTRTINLEIDWKKCDKDSTLNETALADAMLEKFHKIYSISYKDTFYFHYNYCNVYLSKYSKIKNETCQFEYLLFLEFVSKKRSVNYDISILSSDSEELHPIYRSILSYINNVDTAIKEKHFIESFLVDDKLQTGNPDNNVKNNAGNIARNNSNNSSTNSSTNNGNSNGNSNNSNSMGTDKWLNYLLNSSGGNNNNLGNITNMANMVHNSNSNNTSDVDLYGKVNMYKKLLDELLAQKEEGVPKEEKNEDKSS